MLPSLLITAEPCVGATVIVSDAGFNAPPILPALSFAKTFTVTGDPAGVVAISLLASGASVVVFGSNTVISIGDKGQPVV